MDIIIVELAKAIQDGQMLIDDVPDTYKAAVAEIIDPPETEAAE